MMKEIILLPFFLFTFLCVSFLDASTPITTLAGITHHNSKKTQQVQTFASFLAVKKMIADQDIESLQAMIYAHDTVKEQDACRMELIKDALDSNNPAVSRLLIQHSNEGDKESQESFLNRVADRGESKFLARVLNDQTQISKYSYSSNPTPLHTLMAVQPRSMINPRIISALMRQGEDIEARTDILFKGCKASLTPLLEAVWDKNDSWITLRWHVEAIKMMIRWGADCGAKINCDRWTEMNGKDVDDCLVTRWVKFKREAESRREFRSMGSVEEMEQEITIIKEIESYIENFPKLYQKEAKQLCLSHLHADVDEKSQSEMELVMTSFLCGFEGKDEIKAEELKGAIMNNDNKGLLQSLEDDQATQRLDAESYKDQELCETLPEHRHQFSDRGKIVNEKVREKSDSLGYTPLLFAAYVGNVQAVKILLRCNANMNAQNKYNQTASMIAEQQFKATGDQIFKNIQTILNDFRTKPTKRSSKTKKHSIKQIDYFSSL